MFKRDKGDKNKKGLPKDGKLEFGGYANREDQVMAGGDNSKGKSFFGVFRFKSSHHVAITKENEEEHRSKEDQIAEDARRAADLEEEERKDKWNGPAFPDEDVDTYFSATGASSAASGKGKKGAGRGAGGSTA